MKRHLLPLFLASLVLTACSAPANSPPTSLSSSAPTLQSLIHQLASDNFTQRDAAQRQLSALPPNQRPLLQQFSEQTPDTETRARLLACIDAIDLRAILNPPPVSLHVKNATNEDITAALTEALGMPLRIYGQSHDRFTLDADNQPYEQIYQALSAQHSLLLRTEYWTLETMHRIASRGQDAKYFHPPDMAFTFAAAIVPFQDPSLFESGKNVPLPPLAADQMRVTLICQLIADPRIKLLKLNAPGLRSISDDAGNILWTQPDQEPQVAADEAAVWPMQVDLVLSKTSPPKFLSIAGQADLLVQISDFRREIPNIDTHVGVPYQVGPQTITLARYDVKPFARPDRYDVQLEIQSTPSASADANHLECIWVDANGGREIFSGTPNISCGMDSPKPALPAKLIVSVPNKTKWVHIPYEMTHLALP